VEEPEFKSCIVTGANAGLGYWTSMELAKLGWTIFMLCRSEEKGKVAKNEIALETSNSNIHVIVVELSSLKSISKAVEAIRSKTSKIDVLINNAATVSSKRLLTERGVELQFAINHLAPFYLTHLTIPLLIKSKDPRVVNISSNNHKRGKIHFQDITLRNRYQILKAYDQSKLANVLFTYELDRQLKKRDMNISTYCVDPGHINTKIGLKNTSMLHALAWWLRSKQGVTPREGAKCQIFTASSEKIYKQSGQFWKNCKPTKSSPLSYDQKTAKKLWELSLKLCEIEDYLRN